MAPRFDSTDDTADEGDSTFPDASELAAFRAVAEGLDTRVAVERYAPHLLGDGKSARAVLGRTRRFLQRAARLACAQERGERHESLR